jgi:restriction system protein
MKDLKVPQHFRFIIPIVEVLKELGGSGRASEVRDLVIEKLNISEEELSERIKSGKSRIKNQIQWARLMLAKADYIDSSQRGVWSLTEKGRLAELTDHDLLRLYEYRKQLAKEYRKIRLAKKNDTDSDESQIDEVIEDDFDKDDYKSGLLNILQSISPAGFERICQRLLREAGFEQVKVTGKSGDGGIDGIGILQVNPFVSFRVLFQCKRYQGAVSPSQVRDFRGAMQGRADKGIIMTTGTFTTEAKKEARRDGVPPIEIVDGEKLVEMFEHVELGLKPVKTYEIDEKFFDEFMN